VSVLPENATFLHKALFASAIFGGIARLRAPGPCLDRTARLEQRGNSLRTAAVELSTLSTAFEAALSNPDFSLV
jgi:hypothetical protein